MRNRLPTFRLETFASTRENIFVSRTRVDPEVAFAILSYISVNPYNIAHPKEQSITLDSIADRPDARLVKSDMGYKAELIAARGILRHCEEALASLSEQSPSSVPLLLRRAKASIAKPI